jgi:FkbM family methyltransferase
VAVLELHDYNRAIVAFFEATAANPDLLSDADLDGASVVVDAGAYVGEWCERIHDRYGARIYAFEPSPRAFASLERRLGDRPDVSLFDVGLGGRDEAVALDLRQGPGATIYGDPGGGDSVPVLVRDVVEVFDELGLQHIDLLKLNIEGAEYDVLDRLLEAGWLDRIRTVSVQFHEWHPDAHRRRRHIRRALARTHAETWNHPWVWERWDLDEGSRPADQKTIGTESPG